MYDPSNNPSPAGSDRQLPYGNSVCCPARFPDTEPLTPTPYDVTRIVLPHAPNDGVAVGVANGVLVRVTAAVSVAVCDAVACDDRVVVAVLEGDATLARVHVAEVVRLAVGDQCTVRDGVGGV